MAGNPGRRQLNDDEPIPPAGDIAPPEWVMGRALEIWHQVAPIVVSMRTLTTADVLTFARYCLVYARFIELARGLWKQGISGTTWSKRSKPAKGEQRGELQYVQELPQASELRKLLPELNRLEDRFGLSAAARSRIKVQLTAMPTAAANSAKPEDEELRAFFAGGGGPDAPRQAAAE